MRVVSAGVSGLFGMFNHTVPLNREGRVTIIHGPNGFGKTVILNMIAGLANDNYDIFQRVPFEEFRIELDDGTSKVVRKIADGGAQPKKSGTRVELLTTDREGQTTVALLEVPEDIPTPVLDRVDSMIPGPYHRVGPGWEDNNGNSFTLREILAKFPRAAAALPRKFRPSFRNEVGGLDVLFVETNRLRANESLEYSLSQERWWREARHVGGISSQVDHNPLKVEANSQDLVQRIKSALADYAKHSQDRDRTFPERLVRFVREDQRPFDERDLLNKMTALESKRQRLVTLGVLDSESGLRDLSEEDVRRAREALTIYVGDVDEKLRVFDDLVSRIGTLRDILNARFPYKRLVISREQGLQIVTHAGQEIRLGDLSSGEQHQLVVLYELLFRAPKEGLVLVDEPEISLHVAWQTRFLPDLIDILTVTDSYAIVATHSPMIIGSNWNLAVELKGPPTMPEAP